MIIRDATAVDLEMINQIYNHYVATSSATPEDAPWTKEQREKWFKSHLEDGLPVLVVENQGRVVGFASLSRYNDKKAFACTAKSQIYLAGGQTRGGFGAKLYDELLRRAFERPFVSVVASVAHTNEASLRFHEKFGFVEVGRIPRVGMKQMPDGQQVVIDGVILQRQFWT